MRTQKTIETVTCDVCQRECKPVDFIVIAVGNCQPNHRKHFAFKAHNVQDVCQVCILDAIDSKNLVSIKTVE